jgi:hypothetical protein
MDIMNNMEVMCELENGVVKSFFWSKNMSTACGDRAQTRYQAPSWIFGKSLNKARK